MIKKIGIILVIFSVLIIFIKYFNNYKEKEEERVKIDEFLFENSFKNIETNVQTNAQKKNEYKYWIVLEIPKLNLKKGIYEINSSKNNVDKNIQVLFPSKSPDYEKTQLILASHSGNSDVSYFKELHKLMLGDICYIYYNNHKYIYKITKIYYEKKDGDISIDKNINVNQLILITCTFNNENLQTIYINELIKVEKY